ncbi:hypothetical protein B0J15DRAFT_507600 [Fusarium solani]|uniref:Uncharacterized protein n=1 Tax=Fusarium solani TaxID=169388 RepID=A0A9P9L8I5_FUSSL|nr:uncharacterized protein B0J15DRAFT_507600 [Fusarium solani]KAH7276181.1 hypothetical protein B0J15DRAFT_507600 [Fusarium solani]
MALRLVANCYDNLLSPTSARMAVRMNGLTTLPAPPPLDHNLAQKPSSPWVLETLPIGPTLSTPPSWSGACASVARSDQGRHVHPLGGPESQRLTATLSLPRAGLEDGRGRACSAIKVATCGVLKTLSKGGRGWGRRGDEESGWEGHGRDGETVTVTTDGRMSMEVDDPDSLQGSSCCELPSARCVFHDKAERVSIAARDSTNNLDFEATASPVFVLIPPRLHQQCQSIMPQPFPGGIVLRCLPPGYCAVDREHPSSMFISGKDNASFVFSESA